jgi:hypothetical protein
MQKERRSERSGFTILYSQVKTYPAVLKNDVPKATGYALHDFFRSGLSSNTPSFFSKSPMGQNFVNPY